MYANNTIDPNSLEALWVKAESLGEVSVQRPQKESYRYEVSISYHRRSGTYIRAIGRDNELRSALNRVIAEAAALKS